MSEKCVLLDSSIKSLLMILFITSLGTIIHKKLSVRLLNHTNTLSQLTITSLKEMVFYLDFDNFRNHFQIPSVKRTEVEV